MQVAASKRVMQLGFILGFICSVRKSIPIFFTMFLFQISVRENVFQFFCGLQGFSLVLVLHKERDFLVAFGGTKKDPSNQVYKL